ncbi:MAG: class I SAM-dependent methyltransferase [Deltaproteobacteria bacterium]|nr:class I SAM-dependent methyltransferase [Deltaproteobacteria bacterium]
MPQSTDRRTHWENVYAGREVSEVSWHQDTPDSSLQLLDHAAVGPDEAIIDIGGGACLLVDHLLDQGFRQLTVLDISETALDHARARLGEQAAKVRWICADVTEVELSDRYRLWHDRATFHFLVDPAERERYRKTLSRALMPSGHAILATFASDGPETCSGLEVVRYTPEELSIELGDSFELIETWDEEHRTPSGAVQRFVFCRFRRSTDT